MKKNLSLFLVFAILTAAALSLWQLDRFLTAQTTESVQTFVKSPEFNRELAQVVVASHPPKPETLPQQKGGIEGEIPATPYRPPEYPYNEEMLQSPLRAPAHILREQQEEEERERAQMSMQERRQYNRELAPEEMWKVDVGALEHE